MLSSHTMTINEFHGLHVAHDLGVSLTWNECNLSIFPYADEM